MTHPWTLTTPDGLPPALEAAWEAMRARCLEADAFERTVERIVRAAGYVAFDPYCMTGRPFCVRDVNGQMAVRDGWHPTLSAAVAAWASANPEVRDE